MWPKWYCSAIRVRFLTIFFADLMLFSLSTACFLNPVLSKLRGMVPSLHLPGVHSKVLREGMVLQLRLNLQLARERNSCAKCSGHGCLLTEDILIGQKFRSILTSTPMPSHLTPLWAKAHWRREVTSKTTVHCLRRACSKKNRVGSKTLYTPTKKADFVFRI